MDHNQDEKHLIILCNRYIKQNGWQLHIKCIKMPPQFTFHTQHGDFSVNWAHKSVQGKNNKRKLLLRHTYAKWSDTFARTNIEVGQSKSEMEQG